MSKKAELLIEDNIIMFISECDSDPVNDLQGKPLELKIPKEIDGPKTFEIAAQKGKCSWCGEEIEVPRVALRVF